MADDGGITAIVVLEIRVEVGGFHDTRALREEIAVDEGVVVAAVEDGITDVGSAAVLYGLAHLEGSVDVDARGRTGQDGGVEVGTEMVAQHLVEAVGMAVVEVVLHQIDGTLAPELFGTTQLVVDVATQFSGTLGGTDAE